MATTSKAVGDMEIDIAPLVVISFTGLLEKNENALKLFKLYKAAE